MNLKEIFGEDALTVDEFNKRLKNDGIKLADLSTGDYVSKAKYEKVASEKELLESSIEETAEKHKAEIEEVRNSMENEITGIKKQNLLERTLTENNALNVNAAIGAMGINARELELDKDGSIKGMSEMIENLKESDPYLFKSEDKGTVGSGIKSFTPQSGSDGGGTKSSYMDFFKAEVGEV